ncbi:four-carbon acid sugar kinase family protein [Guptibacillus hwajinpoensis]|uniref:four-carbon acid sugar kinase family protein n=1 Tax=Guptibacillus hwajinpoensis TaxID=208199 RepID=UPI0024B34BA5|nr:four-carbon acid sugar kinase family protein [Pseudalkalibacillus hwajinpoensis]
MDRKIIVLDDDPTGVQTIHNLSVYTCWDINSVREGFNESEEMFFILTNSRSFSKEKTIKTHQEIAKNIVKVSKESGKDFVIICRGDSTLRGHYILEMDIISATIRELTGREMDGQIICPSFFEGGRITIDNIHYLKEKDKLVPIAETEFSKDKTFGYYHSHLGLYIEEKTNGLYKENECMYIDHKELKKANIYPLMNKLDSISNEKKVIVNATEYSQLEFFCESLRLSLANKKNFIIRSAASFVKVFGRISDKPLLTGKELLNTNNQNGGLIIVGSHVDKTTKQLKALMDSNLPVTFLEFNIQKVIKQNKKNVIQTISNQAQNLIQKGQNVVIFTSREVFISKAMDDEELLEISVQISNALSSIVMKLESTPSFIIAKGGITSSDIAKKGLNVIKARVLGQITKGVPVWITGIESKFPNFPYIIFPGNIGEDSYLKDIIEELGKRKTPTSY